MDGRVCERETHRTFITISPVRGCGKTLADERSHCTLFITNVLRKPDAERHWLVKETIARSPPRLSRTWPQAHHSSEHAFSAYSGNTLPTSHVIQYRMNLARGEFGSEARSVVLTQAGHAARSETFRRYCYDTFPDREDSRGWTCHLRAALGGGGSRGTPKPPPDDEAALPPSKFDVVEVVVAVFFWRPGIEIENVWPSLRE